MARVVLAMSGGVDSSVAAHLLQQAGHDVIGVFMRHGESHATACATGTESTNASELSRTSNPALKVVSSRLGHKQGCCTASDAADARRVADRLDIPFYAIDFQEDFRQIIDYFVDEYRSARTPNPCVMCNNWIKFGRLFEYADGVDAQFVATGHYARLISPEHGNGVPALACGIDASKDQSYVLFGIEPQMLERMMLPVGEYHKSEIRRIARGLGLDVAEKRDSQEICFVPDGDHAAFIHDKRGPSESAGEIVTSDGRVVGQHAGLEAFTIGQRKGLGVALGEPKFVIRLERDTHRVVLGDKQELLRDRLTADRTNWLTEPPTAGKRCTIKIRYNAPAVPGMVETLSGDRLRAVFDQPQHAVAPGQAVVCYDGQRVLGGGWIE